jgi:hypothetical protein
VPGKFDEDDIMVLPFDLLDFESHKDIVAQALKHFNKVSILSNISTIYMYGHSSPTT